MSLGFSKRIVQGGSPEGLTVQASWFMGTALNFSC